MLQIHTPGYGSVIACFTAAQEKGATKEQLIMASCAVARLALPLIPSDIVGTQGENVAQVAREAIETAEAFCRGSVPWELVEKYMFGIWEIASEFYAVNPTISRAAYAVAYSADVGGSHAQHRPNVNCYIPSFWALRAGVNPELVLSTVKKSLASL